MKFLSIIALVLFVSSQSFAQQGGTPPAGETAAPAKAEKTEKAEKKGAKKAHKKHAKKAKAE